MADYILELRKKLGKDRIFTPSANAIIINSQHEILLQKRASHGDWGVPGGFIDFGEKVKDCMKREVLEETGLVVRSFELFGIYSGLKYQGSYKNGDKIQSLAVVFLVTDFSGDLNYDEESLDMKFFSIDNLPLPLGKHHEDCIFDYIDYSQGNKQLPVVC